MKTSRLRKVTSFWKSLFFMWNVCKMRRSLMSYLTEEGLKCELTDGDVVFEFDECHFTTSFVVSENFGECVIRYQCGNDDSKKLDMNDKVFMANKVNTDMENHATVYAFNNSIQVCTSFYFTSEGMMIELFSKHFEELTKSLDEAIEIVCDMMEEQKKVQRRRIGFNTDAYQHEKDDNTGIAAKA